MVQIKNLVGECGRGVSSKMATRLPYRRSSSNQARCSIVVPAPSGASCRAANRLLARQRVPQVSADSEMSHRARTGHRFCAHVILKSSILWNLVAAASIALLTATYYLRMFSGRSVYVFGSEQIAMPRHSQFYFSACTTPQGAGEAVAVLKDRDIIGEQEWIE
jgi:hypothetical protein